VEIYERTRLIAGNNLEKIISSHVAIFGIGGVGGYIVEALARLGVGRLTLIDFDTVSASNINRQIVALSTTIGLQKVEVMKQRISEINKDIRVEAFCQRVDERSIEDIDFSSFDCIADAVDDVAAKLLIIKKAKNLGKKIVCCMGAGNKTEATFFAADISQTSVCPLAKSVRTALKKEGISDVRVVYSKQPPTKPSQSTEGRKIGSLSFVVGAAGMKMAEEVFALLQKN
jgi:tRNA A37 threonylcarbamoyladenosine dehydratase